MKTLLHSGRLVLVPETDEETAALAAWRAAHEDFAFAMQPNAGTGATFAGLGPRPEACHEPINVTSMSPHPVRLIANFAPTPFELDGVHYVCVEAFWQSLRFPPEERGAITALAGSEAKGRGSQRPYGTHVIYGGSEVAVGAYEHWQLMRRACRAKFEQNADAREALLGTGTRPLIHVVEHDSRTIPGVIMAKIWMDLRAGLAPRAPVLDSTHMYGVEPMDHLKTVTEEFARQAQTFDAWAQKTDDQVASRFRSALGAAGGGDLIDIACGPGVVTAAIAPGARSVTAFDATDAMLEKARARCAKAGLANIAFAHGDAEHLPFPDARFDGLVNRLAIHHFADPQRALAEMFRVLRPGGIAVIVDIISSEDRRESDLHNAIERLRDPSHVRMLPASELEAGVTRAGFAVLGQEAWDMPREFEEWAAIANDTARVEPLRTVVRELAQAGRSAGTGFAIENGRIVFLHRWRLLRAHRPRGN